MKRKKRSSSRVGDGSGKKGRKRWKGFQQYSKYHISQWAFVIGRTE